MGNRGSDYKRRQIKKQLQQIETVCWLCWFPLDNDAPANTDYATELDEITPASLGGDTEDINNIHLAHRICNNYRDNNADIKDGMLREWFMKRAKVKAQTAAEPTKKW